MRCSSLQWCYRGKWRLWTQCGASLFGHELVSDPIQRRRIGPIHFDRFHEIFWFECIAAVYRNILRQRLSTCFSSNRIKPQFFARFQRRFGPKTALSTFKSSIRLCDSESQGQPITIHEINGGSVWVLLLGNTGLSLGTVSVTDCQTQLAPVGENSTLIHGARCL